MTLHCALCARRLRSDQVRYRVAEIDSVHNMVGRVAAWYCARCWLAQYRLTAVLRDARQKLQAADPYRRTRNRSRQLSLLATTTTGTTREGERVTA